MKKTTLTSFILIFFLSFTAMAQEKPDYSKIDMMLVRGEYNKVIDTCSKMLATDSLNAEINFKMGVAYQNLISDDKALACFLKAAAASPDNNDYNFTIAKSYFNKGKIGKAKPILLKLCAADTTNWPYAYYLTSIYMQEDQYDEAIKLYYRFYKKDYFNYTFADKIGFAYLQKGDFDTAIGFYNRSLALNPVNTNAIKNLAYLYAGTISADTAVKLLTRGISIDSTDMDLYARRAAINYTRFDYKEALTDYLKILSSGDSALLNLKRAGIGFAINRQPKEAVEYLSKAYRKDTADAEIIGSLAQNYMVLHELKNSEYYYRCLIKIYSPISDHLGLTWLLLAEVLKSDSQFSEAISAYIKSQQFRSDNNVYMIIANLYDEKLKDTPKAIRYYELYLNKLKNSRDKYDSDYTESVRKRIESLKKIEKTPKQP
jgi:tetratricopeptide (TPR) repeat protein